MRCIPFDGGHNIEGCTWVPEGVLLSSETRELFLFRQDEFPAASDEVMETKPKKGKKAPEEGDSEYSPWLGMEHYHDATTGENYWVSPSRDWNETGPQGPGYYTRIGNDTKKLEPGLSQ